MCQTNTLTPLSKQHLPSFFDKYWGIFELKSQSTKIHRIERIRDVMNWCIFWRKWHKEASSRTLLWQDQRNHPLGAQDQHSEPDAHRQQQNRADTFRLEKSTKKIKQNSSRLSSREGELLLGNWLWTNSPLTPWKYTYWLGAKSRYLLRAFSNFQIEMHYSLY